MTLRVTEIHAPDLSNPLPLPLAEAACPAGFPSPADDFLEKRLDLNEHLVKNPASTFFVRVAGDSMTGAGIHDGDLLVVDRSLRPADGNVVIAVLDGELLVKRLLRSGGRVRLTPENPAYETIEIHSGSDFTVWGVVTNVVHGLLPRRAGA